MKIRFIKSACVVVEFNGIKVLCDPWLTDGVYYGSWYHYPPLKYNPEDFQDIDYIYISHIHPDHMDKYSLERFSKDIPILIHDYQEKFLLKIIQAIGFKNVIEISHKQPFALSPNFTIEILAADNCNPELCGKFFGCAVPNLGNKTLQIDSLAVFHDGENTIVNTNDCQYELAGAVCDYIKGKYPKIDCILVGYSSATAYPQCFENLDIERKIQEKFRIRDLFLRKAGLYIKHLMPKYFFPFAGQYVLGGKFHVLNKFRSPPYVEELPNLFPSILQSLSVNSNLILLNSGESFDLETEKTSSPFVKDDPKERKEYIEKILSTKKYLYETEYQIPKEEQIDLFERLQKAHKKMWEHQNIFGYKSNWSVYIDVGFDFLYRISFNGEDVERISSKEFIKPYLKISLDYSLLVMILDKKAHWNNAEIGSHLKFYRDPEEYEVGVFRFLSFLHN